MFLGVFFGVAEGVRGNIRSGRQGVVKRRQFKDTPYSQDIKERFFTDLCFGRLGALGCVPGLSLIHS